MLINHGDHSTRAADSASMGGEKYMSSRDMYNHLNLLQERVPVRHKFLRRPTLSITPEQCENSFGNRSYLVPRVGHVAGR